MIYVNTTGKHIGECLTGFGASYPVIIYNSGNSDVEYTITVENNTDIFNVSDSQFIINNGSTGKFDILYKPQITASTGDETTEISIFGQSVEDGSVDPSGLITLEITGSRIISNTAGAVRRFVALKNYDIINGINYDFIWYPPTGTGSLKNYYFTGYRLDIATGTDFITTTVFTTGITKAQNTTDNPRFATFYGYPELENILNVSQKDFPSLALETNYYARIYTYSTNNTGISIYATGIESISQQLSEEVINGNSGSKLNIRFDKKPLNVYVPNGNYTNYNLNTKIIETNDGSNNLLFYSGINIYLANQSTFTSSDENNYALNLNNQIFENFTGDSNGTFINLFVPYNCRIVGNFGKGGDIITSDVYIPSIYGTPNIYANKLITKTTAEYNKQNPVLSDSKPGGNVFKLDAKTQTDRKDFIYNIYSEKNSFIAAGGGGNKAGIATFGGYFHGISSDNLIKGNLLPLNGAYNKFGQNIKYDIYYGPAENARENKINRNETTLAANIFSDQSGYGQDGSDSFYLNPINRSNNKGVENGYYYRPSPGLIYTNPNDVFAKDIDSPFTITFLRMPGTVSSAGNIVEKYSNSSLRYSFYNTDIPTDYLFRLSNADISNTPSLSWAAKNINSSTIFTLDTAEGSGNITYTNNFNSTGYKALTFLNKSLKGVISSSTETCKNFDLFIVGCFDSTIAAPKKFSMVNWYANPESISINQVNYRTFLRNFVNTYDKEPNVFNFFASLLYNYRIDNNTNDFFLFNNNAVNSYYQLSKSLNPSITIYPFVLNIKRNGSVYSIYVNGELHTFYDLNFNTPQQNRNLTNFLSSIVNTTFRLENNDSSMSTSFFDILCYNRVLFDDENRKVNNHLLQNYIKLFTGETANEYLTISSQIKMPNVFNLAGKISSI